MEKTKEYINHVALYSLARWVLIATYKIACTKPTNFENQSGL